MTIRFILAVLSFACFLAAFCAATVPSFWIFALLEPIRKYAVGGLLVAGLVLGAFAVKGRRA